MSRIFMTGFERLYMPTATDIQYLDGVWERWRLEGFPGYNGAAKDAAYLKHCQEITSPLYMCNRPPGAAGALIVTADKIVYGWVAPPSGTLITCLTDGCEMVDGHCVRNIHAEVQAVCRAARYGLRTKDATIYSLLKPCYNCSKIIIAAGIKRIVYAGAAYDEPRTRNLLYMAEVACDYIDIGLGYGIEMEVVNV